MMLEEWRPIDGFPGYAISNYGRVFNETRQRPVKQSPVQYNMMTVALVREGKQYRRSVGTLVAQTFLSPEREDFNTPIHLDGDRANCCVDNLMWRPRWFAVTYHLELRANPFMEWNQDIVLNDTGEIFGHISEPAMKYGLLQSEIHKSIINGVRVFPPGFTFSYVDFG